MNLVFFNNSKLEISIEIDNSLCQIPSKSTITISDLEPTIDIKLITSSNSYIHKSHDKVIGYHFNVEGEYNISSTKEIVNITLNVIGVNGDHYEYYLRVVPVSTDSNIKLKNYSIPDLLTIKNDVISDYNAKQERNNKMKKSRKRDSLIMDIILDVLYSALPVIFFVYLFAHNHVSTSTMVGIIAVILAFVVIISELTRKFYDKVLKKHVDKLIHSEDERTKFDINSVFEESYIRYIVNDTERYQNKK